MTSIAEFVELNMPETYKALTDPGLGNHPGMVGALTSTVLERLGFADEAAVSALPKGEFAKSFIADLVTRMMIPSGIDYWQVQARLTDSTSLPAGFEPGGGETASMYDRVRGLQILDELLAGRIAANQVAFTDAIDQQDAVIAAFGVSSKVSKVQDPQTAWPAFDCGELVYQGYGVAIAIRGV